METLRISVVITVLNDAEGIAALLEALAGQTKPADEIIVVDGGSTDDTPGVVEKHTKIHSHLRRLSKPGCNIAQGRNAGIEHARHEIIVCTDAGCAPDRDWLGELTDPFRRADVAVVGGVCKAAAHNRLERVIGLMTVAGELAPIEPATYNPSARNMAFRKAAWRRAGGFPEWLYTAEDTLFDCALRKLGVGFAYVPSAKVFWRPRRTLSALWQQIQGYAQGEGHIGRAGGSARFWGRRYIFSLGVMMACYVSAYMLSSLLPIAVAPTLVAILLVAPLWTKASRVARKTGRAADFPLALLVGHVMAAADAVGYARGVSQRKRNPRGWQAPLRMYWGADRVGDVPLWRLVNPATPNTLVVSWHWAPNGRACANVLSNLFVCADRRSCAALTRAMPGPRTGDTIATPTWPTTRVSWPIWCKQESGIVFTAAAILVVIKMLLRASKLCRHQTFDRLLAVYPHRFSLLAGWLIARSQNTKLVVYMHDLLAESLGGQGFAHRMLWRCIDRVVLDRAWLIVVPTREFADHYRRRGLERVLVIPHCTPCDLASASWPSRVFRKQSPLTLIYTGKLYEAHADAMRALLAATQNLNGVSLSLFSNASDVSLSKGSTWVSRRDALKAIERADVGVVVLGAKTPYPDEVAGCFPSKMVDYIAIGRPILAVVPRHCFVERFVRENGCGVVAESFSSIDIRAALADLMDPQRRRRMAQATQVIREKLSGKKWWATLSDGLAVGPTTETAWPIVSCAADDALATEAANETLPTDTVRRACEPECGVSL